MVGFPAPVQYVRTIPDLPPQMLNSPPTLIPEYVSQVYSLFPEDSLCSQLRTDSLYPTLLAEASIHELSLPSSALCPAAFLGPITQIHHWNDPPL